MSLKSPVLPIILTSILLTLFGCSVLETTLDAAKIVGKLGWETTKFAGKTVVTTGKVAWKTGEITGKGIKTIVTIAKGKQIVPLEKRGNGLYAWVTINRKEKAKLLIDTGASYIQISRSLAGKLGINISRGKQTTVMLAGGHAALGYIVSLQEVKVAGARLNNIEAIVLNEDNMNMSDGLLGMSFLKHFNFQINPQPPELTLQRRVE